MTPRRIHRPETITGATDLSRRGFLGAAGTAAMLGAAACGAPGSSGFQASPLSADGLDFDESGTCLSGPTGTDALGPYWTNNVRRTIQLAGPQQVGQRLVISGRLLANDCRTPITGATIAAWQADDEGLYDYNHAGLDAGTGDRPLLQEETNLRGYFVTSVSGTYVLETIFPRQYPLNLLDPANSAYRAPHVHFAVFFRGADGVDRQLVTQMYFRDNELIRSHIPTIAELNAQDGGASTAETGRLIDVTGVPGEVWHGTFDLVLSSDPDLV